jgi:hypothetical protein
MREKNLLQLLLILNGTLAACFVVYLLLSSNSQPRVTTTTFAPLPAVTNRLASAPGPTALRANVAPAPKATNEAVVQPTPVAATNQPTPQPVFTQKKFGWQQVESEEYKPYLDSLRAVGCPEEKVRYIIMTDINELFAMKRLKEAVDHDPQWWRAEPELTIANVLQEKGRKLEAERRALIEKLLGKEALELDKSEMVFWSNVQLTGPVLGSLPAEVHQTVQEICGRSIERTRTRSGPASTMGNRSTRLSKRSCASRPAPIPGRSWIRPPLRNSFCATRIMLTSFVRSCAASNPLR